MFFRSDECGFTNDRPVARPVSSHTYWCQCYTWTGTHRITWRQIFSWHSHLVRRKLSRRCVYTFAHVITHRVCCRHLFHRQQGPAAVLHNDYMLLAHCCLTLGKQLGCNTYCSSTPFVEPIECDKHYAALDLSAYHNSASCCTVVQVLSFAQRYQNAPLSIVYLG
jgi:hypothetical protein